MEKKSFIWEMLEGTRPLSPAARLLGWKLLALDPEEGTSRAEFRVPPEFTNANGSIHGGFIVAMLDQCMGPALIARLGPSESIVTLSLNTHFVASARTGTLLGIGRVISMGKSTCVLEARLTDEADNLIATATSTLRIVRQTAP